MKAPFLSSNVLAGRQKGDGEMSERTKKAAPFLSSNVLAGW